VTADSSPLGDLEFALVGPGRVGSTLALWLVARGARCLSVAGRAGSPAAARLAGRLGASTAPAGEIADEAAKLVLIAVPDSEIPEVARRAAARRRRGIVLHVSGALGVSVLAPLSASGCRVGSFHPLRAFPAVEEDPGAARGTFFALDGDAEARALGRRLAEALGGESAVVGEEARPLYHWAATLAAGGVVTLLATAQAVARRLNLPAAAERGYAHLAQGALEAAVQAPSPAAAMTGPVARGDVATVEAHLEALSATAPDLLPLAVEIARGALARRVEAGAETPAQQALSDRLKRTDLLDRPKDRVLTSSRSRPT